MKRRKTKNPYSDPYTYGSNPFFEENTTGQHDPFIQLTIKCYLYSEANDSDFSPSLSVLLDAFASDRPVMRRGRR